MIQFTYLSESIQYFSLPKSKGWIIYGKSKVVQNLLNCFTDDNDYKYMGQSIQKWTKYNFFGAWLPQILLFPFLSTLSHTSTRYMLEDESLFLINFNQYQTNFTLYRKQSVDLHCKSIDRFLHKCNIFSENSFSQKTKDIYTTYLVKQKNGKRLVELLKCYKSNCWKNFLQTI